MESHVQIGKFRGGLAVTRVVDGDKVWDRHYSNLQAACKEAVHLGLITSTDAREASTGEASIRRRVMYVDTDALMDAGFERAKDGERERIYGLY